MNRKEEFAHWLTCIGGVLLVINTISVALAHYWFVFGLNCLFFLALIIYALAVYFSGK